MSSSPLFHVHAEVRPDRTSDAPLALDMTGSAHLAPPPNALSALLARLPQQWLGVSGYLIAGVFLGLVLIVALSVSRRESLPPASAGAITDNVVRLHGRDVSEACWKGTTKTAHITVSMEIGLDGKVRRAVAAGGESPTMRSCVENHVKSWEFLPQATASTMVLPFEIDAR